MTADSIRLGTSKFIDRFRKDPAAPRTEIEKLDANRIYQIAYEVHRLEERQARELKYQCPECDRVVSAKLPPR